ncbi:cell adhesion molecule 2-like [Anneissia japonica]|uniref:cell adhesion molecule 2-like n=1 Tax=Anneissia japonica TaxID=1529436 RepID=UPI00142559B8|nr:cell adhesion molecule 2-like [Anneissia japonica]
MGSCCKFSFFVLLLQFGMMYAITFRQGPQSTHVHEGEQAVLTCAVDDKKAGNFVFWHLVEENAYISYDSSVYPEIETGRFSVTGDYSNGEFNLVIFEVSAQDVGTYQCGFYFNNGTRSEFIFKEAIVSLIIPPSPFYPQCSWSSRSMYPKPGDTISLGCISFGGIPAALLSWWKNDTMMMEPKSNIASLTHILIPDDNGAKFFCFATGLALPKPRLCMVVPMTIPPTVEVHISDPSPLLYSELTINCVINVVGSIQHIHWYWEGERIVKDSKNRLSIIMDGERIVIPSTKPSDNNTLVSCFVTTNSGLHGNGSVRIELSMDQSVSTTVTDIKHQSLPKAPSGETDLIIPVTLSVIVILLAVIFISIFVKRIQTREERQDGKHMTKNSIMKDTLGNSKSNGNRHNRKRVTFNLSNISPKLTSSKFTRINRMKAIVKNNPDKYIETEEHNEGFVEDHGIQTISHREDLVYAELSLDPVDSNSSQITDNTEHVTYAELRI